jgi:hypothetical protein
MGQCRDCRFWDTQGVCSRVGYADVDLDDSSFEIVSSADDDQGSWGQLVTGPNFGCIKFERRVQYEL